MILNNLGVLYHSQKRFEEASSYFSKSINIKPDFVLPYLGIGKVARDKGNYIEALKYYEDALNLDSDNAETHFQIGYVYYRMRDTKCLKYFKLASKLNPDLPNIYKNLGMAYIDFDMLSQAKKALEVAQSKDPNNVEIKYFLCIAKKKEPDANLIADFAKNEFDNFAHTFDEVLSDKLKYNIPQYSRTKIENIFGGVYFDAVVDLGCGTGMNGLAFRDCSGHITGIDISKEMVLKASEKKCYDKLIQGEVIEELRKTTACFDLFIANDVFIYIGQLDLLFQTVKNKAKPNAYFIFSTESNDSGSDKYVLLKSGRFAHNPAYIRELCNKYQYEIIVEERVNIRKEQQGWIKGDFFLIRMNIEYKNC